MTAAQNDRPDRDSEGLSVSRLPPEEEVRFSAPAPEIEGYQILDKLGEAGQGQVWRAVQLTTQRQVALKVPRVGLLSSRKTLIRFEREVEIVARLRHPNIASIIDSGVQRGLYYYAMELVQGQHLDQYVKDHDLSHRQILELMKVVCEAVQHAHQIGVIHRDLKPSNIIVGETGHPYVVDFGLAKSMMDAHPAATVSLEGEVAGTPAYMSPEQAAGNADRVDTRTDVYSLGAILFTLLTGQYPHDLSGSHFDVLRRLLEEEVIQPRKLSPKMDRDLESLLLKALERDPNRRYSSAAGLAEDIDNYLKGLPLIAAPQSQAYRVRSFIRRHRAGVLAGSLMAVSGVIALCVLSVSTVMIAREKDRTHDALESERRAAEGAAEARALAEGQRGEAIKQRDLAYQNLYVGQIRLAPQYWQAGQILRMKEMLDDYMPEEGGADLRGWEWYYLLSLCHEDAMTLRGHTSQVSSVAWSPDGQSLASADENGMVRIWDAVAGREGRVFRAHNGSVSRVAWSPDGKNLASAGSDRVARVWDSAAGKEVHTLRGHSGGVNAVEWSPDGRRLASASSDRTVRVWDASTGQGCLTFHGHTSDVECLAWSPDGRWVVSGDSEGRLIMWEALTGQEIHAWQPFRHDLWAVAWDPSGHSVAVGGYGNPVLIMDAATGETKVHIPLPCTTNCIVWSPDGRFIATASWNQMVQLWDVQTGSEVSAFRGHEGWVKSVAFSPDGRQLASGGNDREVKIWNRDRGEPPLILQHPSVHGVAWNPKTGLLASAGGGKLRIWEPRTGREVVSWDVPEGVESIAWDSEGTRLAGGPWGDPGNTLKAWDSTTGREVFSLPGGSNPAWSPDGRRLAFSLEETVEVWDLQTRERILGLTEPGESFSSVSWSPDGRKIAAGGAGLVIVWDGTSGKRICVLEGHQRDRWVGALAWSPDSNRVVSGGWDQEIQVWDIEKGRETASLIGHTGAIFSLSWSPDGRRIASSGSDLTVKVWDIVTGRELLTLPSHAGRVSSVAWSPDGRQLASAAADGRIRIWNAEEGYETESSPDYRQGRCKRYHDRAIDFVTNLRFREACEAFSRALKLDPSWTTARYERSQAYWQLKEYGSAMADLEHCMDEEPNRIEYLQQFAWSLATCPEPALYDLPRAAQCAGTAIRLSPLDGAAHTTLSLIHYRMRQWQQALDASQRALDLYCRPRAFDLLLQAMAHWQLGERGQALKQYRRAVGRLRESQPPTSSEVELQREAGRLLRVQVAASDFDWDLKGAEITGMTATSNCDPISGTALGNLLNRAGLSDRDHDGVLEHDTDGGHMWLGHPADGDPWIEVDLGGIHPLDAVRVWNFNAQAQTHRGTKTADILVWTKEDGWTKVLDDVELDEAVHGNDCEPTVIPLGGVRAEKLRMDHLKSFGDPAYVGLAKLQLFDVRGNQAGNPYPADGTDIGVEPTLDLRWAPALDAVAYRVYLGDNPQSLTLVGEALDARVAESVRLERCKWYCWRVDAVRADGSVAEGKLWTFSTGDLVGWWQFNEKGGRVVTDSSGRGNHGRFAGDPQRRSNDPSGVVSLDGQDDYVYIGDEPDFDMTSEITLACRVRVNRFTRLWQPIITKGNRAWRLIRAANERHVEFACTGMTVEGTSWGNLSGKTPIDDDRWHRVVGVCDGRRLYLYVDGLLDCSVECSGKMNSTTDPVLIGANAVDPIPDQPCWSGLIDDVRIYSYALTSREVKALCAGGGPGPLARPAWAAQRTKE